MSTTPVSSKVLTMEICPNCKAEMSVTEVAPILLHDHLETITYRCEACRSELKRNFERRSEVWKLIHPDPYTQYRVAFFKRLLSSNGQSFKCLQHTVEIRRAKSTNRAIKAAERRYERLHHASDWRLYADSFELEACSPDGRPN